MTQWGNYGSGDGQFNYPRGVAVDSGGNVYVVDTSNHRIQVFSDGYPPPHPVSGLVLNGSFEAAPALIEWAYGGTLSVTRSSNATQGSYSLQLGVPVPQQDQGEGQASAHQIFYVNPSWTRPILSFAYNMWVNDVLGFSDFFVEIQDGVGLNHLATVVRDGYQSCSNTAPPVGTDLGWRTTSYDLSPYKGQSIRLIFANRNLWPNSWGIWTYVDDVRVVDAGPAPPYLVFLPVSLKNATPTGCP